MSKWRIADSIEPIIVDENGDVVCTFLIGPKTMKVDMARANLICAAPELLEITKAYRNLLKTMAHTEGEIATFCHIEQVIAKAKGKE